MYVKSDSQLPNFTDLFDAINLIVVVDDVNVEYSKLNITAATDTGEDYDSYTKRELARLPEYELDEIESVGALTKLYEMHEAGFYYKLNPNQLKRLGKEWKDFTDYKVTTSDVRDVLRMIGRCNHLTAPQYRASDISKNFAKSHGIIMDDDDYLNILKDVKADECITKFNGVSKNDGTELFVFIHPGNNYKLLKEQTSPDKQFITDDIKIYIKIAVNPQTKLVLSFVSFHDPDAEESPLFPNYYDIPEYIYDLAKLVGEKADELVALQYRPGTIKNRFRYDEIKYTDDALTIIFVDSYDEDFEVSIDITTPITEETIPEYVDILSKQLSSDWFDADNYYRSDYGQTD